MFFSGKERTPSIRGTWGATSSRNRAHEHDTESRVSAFKAELMNFAALDVSNEEILRDMIHKMINRVDVHEDGTIEISCNFQNPLKQGA